MALCVALFVCVASWWLDWQLPEWCGGCSGTQEKRWDNISNTCCQVLTSEWEHQWWGGGVVRLCSLLTHFAPSVVQLLCTAVIRTSYATMWVAKTGLWTWIGVARLAWAGVVSHSQTTILLRLHPPKRHLFGGQSLSKMAIRLRKTRAGGKGGCCSEHMYL